MDEPINNNQEPSVVKQRKYNEGGITGKGFKKGQSGNPKGRPKGKTIKEQVREWLDTHPQDNADFVKHFIKNNRELAWQMMEGRPAQDLTSKGEAINPMPIYGNKSVQISGHDGDQEDIQLKEKN